MDFIKPNYYEILNYQDQQLYQLIQSQLSSPNHSNKKNKKITFFKDALESILLYEDRSNADKWKRCLVCGIVFFEGGIGINTSQLSKLFHRCKSSINSSLNEIGYSHIVAKSQGNQDLIREIPNLEKMPLELRKWTTRYFNDNSDNINIQNDEEKQNDDKLQTDSSDNDPLDFDDFEFNKFFFPEDN